MAFGGMLRSIFMYENVKATVNPTVNPI